MKRGADIGLLYATAFASVALLAIGCSDRQAETVESAGGVPGAEEGNLAADQSIRPRQLKILYPLDGALFPPEIAAPTFRWEDEACDAWRIEFRFQEGEPMEFSSRSPDWTPSDESWETIKRRTLENEATVTVLGVADAARDKVFSKGRIRMGTSKDEVGAPLFFREVNLPFATAVKNPAAHIRWRFGPISSKEPPPIVLEKLPVCGNCHSFSADGSTLALEVDSGNDKGSYAITAVEEQIVLDERKIITWSDYRREDGELTFGLLCQASPDGRYIVGTVKDRALAVYREELAFSQLFFLVKGILAVYDRQKDAFTSLPGADDPRYVQTNATWSPDGKTIVFARAEAYEPKGISHIDSVLLPQEAAEDFLERGRLFRYDLYRIPFNDGKGGKAEPIEGASQNGMSNYFAKFSPDGKWIVFCKANSFMLLQPDSGLYVIPAQGGEARRLQCNTGRMNSWHSWSPNGKWLVFSSKAYSVYTQLFLTHLDHEGRSTPPVVLSRFTDPQRAANIPEFANVPTDAIRSISARFLDDHNYYRAATEFLKQNDGAGAIPLLEESLDINPKNVPSRLALARILADQGKSEQSRTHLIKTLELEPDCVEAHYGLADILVRDGNNQEAKSHLLKVIELQPDHADAHHSLAVLLHKEVRLEEAADHCRRAIDADPNHHDAYTTLGMILLDGGKLDQSVEPLQAALRLKPKDAFANYICGHAYHRQFKLAEAADHYRRAVQCDPEYVPALLGLASIHIIDGRAELFDVDEAVALAEKACEVTGQADPAALEILSGVYVAAGRLGDAVTTARNALEVGRRAGDQRLVERLQKNLDLYERVHRGQ